MPRQLQYANTKEYLKYVEEYFEAKEENSLFLTMPPKAIVQKYELRKIRGVRIAAREFEGDSIDYHAWGWALFADGDERAEDEGRVFNTWVNFFDFYQGKSCPYIGQMLRYIGLSDQVETGYFHSLPRMDDPLDEIVAEINPSFGEGPILVKFDMDKGKWLEIPKGQITAL